LESYYSSLEGYPSDSDVKLSSNLTLTLDVSLGAAFQEIIPFLGYFNRINTAICKFMPPHERQYLAKISSYQGQIKQNSFFENEEWQDPILPPSLPNTRARKSSTNESSYMAKLQLLQSAILEDDDIEEL
jgi:hypothetical protein